jgi:hypothetical protein
MCVCDKGWGTDTSVVPDGNTRYIFNWCNKKILDEHTLSLQAQKIIMLSVSFIKKGFTVLVAILNCKQASH